MVLTSNLEFRGASTKISSKTGNSYTFISVEDNNADAYKFLASNEVDIKSLKKGEKYTFTFDFNAQFKSLKIVGVK